MTECLVCGDHSDGQHFGIYACRACAAFFRRSTVSGKEYKCRFNNCCEIGKDVRCMCRACRLRKCLEMGMNANCVQRYRDELGKRTSFSRSIRRESTSSSTDSGSPSSSSNALSPLRSASFFCNEQPSCSSSGPVTWTLAPSRTPLIDQMVAGYDHLIAERVRVHSVMTIPNGRRLFDPDRLGFEKATRESACLAIHADVPLVIEMLRTSFPPYFDFPPQQRGVYFRNFFGHFLFADPAYRTSKVIPSKNDSRYLLQTEQLYWDFNDMYDYFSDSRTIDVDEAVKLFSPMFQMIVANLKDPMVDVGMTKQEMVAVLGLCLFADGKEGASAECVEKCNVARQILYRELFEVCKAQSGDRDVSVRFGTIIAFVPTVMKLCTRFFTKISLAKLYGIVEYDPKVYALFADTI
ncbi:hypothetical protein QR680_018219 [Steinernema hermaphroditum]|uniref:Nuclear receptor domain-containing protein n=1 Tax=Steinernema hermaphroditum TaxID=289476 RepID=A0AA39LQR5_9BILA|nr:hypothetical protein QR680_018219 [Steinernema hermaphroditum]